MVPAGPSAASGPSSGPDADASSLSEISAVSTSSLCSPKNPKNSSGEESSILILETSEFGGLITRHYLIPGNLNKSGRGKLKRKGVKLHVVAEHIFVAKHFKR